MRRDKRSVALQREYYARTADHYDAMHSAGAGADPEHVLALGFMLSVLDFYGIGSVLDVGAGTGRVLHSLADERPDLEAVGVEPSPELREKAHEKGIPRSRLVAGDAHHLPFADGAFDLVCEFAVLHHVLHPAAVVAEMLRVARLAIFISDSNNFGQGPWLVRLVKQAIGSVGLWALADFVKTGGKGYTYSPNDGVAYSYSVFNDYRQIRRQCAVVHVLNTRDGGINAYRSASTVALLGIKEATDASARPRGDPAGAAT